MDSPIRNPINRPRGLKRVTLNDLEPDSQEILIVGVIIGKQRPKKFTDRVDDNGDFKAVWNFTLRDSIRDYINVTLWANHQLVADMSEKCFTGDVVEIIRPRVVIRRFDDYGEQFRPRVTSPFTLTLNEQSDILLHTGDITHYQRLLRYPTKPLAGFIALRDIHNEGDSFKERFVDILGAVRTVGNIRTIVTKTREELQLREVLVFDHTHSGLKVTLWDVDTMIRAGTWKARSTIIFITDVKVQWSAFSRTYSASQTSRSIVTENPQGHEANYLAEYAKNAVLEKMAIVDQMITNIPDPDTIQNVMCVKQVHNRINTIIQQDDFTTGIQFTALMFVVVSQLDLDGFSRNISAKCGNCKGYLKTPTSTCENVDCLGGLADPDVCFDIRVDLSDHSGTLKGCRLSGTTAEQLFNCTAHQFGEMADNEKCILKWKYLLQRCAVRIMVMFFNQLKPTISIVSCSMADPLECVERVPVY